MNIKLDENLPRALVRILFETEETGNWSGCFIVLTDHKLRIRRPGGK